VREASNTAKPGSSWDDARDPMGRPRFFAPGTHPATRRHRENLTKLRQYPESPERDALIEHTEFTLAMFEEGESEAKQRYLMVRDG
jgi:hypothetical protein